MSILEPGKIVAGRYQVLSLIGSGGYGEVWRARKVGVEAWDKTVALKVMLPVAHEDERAQITELFVAEARIAAKLSHPNVVTVNEFGVDDGRRIFFIEMPFIEGRDLYGIMRRSQGRLPLPLALYVANEFLKGLDYIHRQGFVYRDIKPENVLVSVEGAVQLADFGVAKQANVATRMVKGTLGYIAPELYRAGAQPNARSDLFAFGVLLYRSLTGHPLFAAEDLPQAYASVLEGFVAPLANHGVAAPPALEQLVRALLSVAPDGRPASASEARRALLAIPGARDAGSDDLARHLQTIGIRPSAEGATQAAPQLEERRTQPLNPTPVPTPTPAGAIELPPTTLERPPRSRLLRWGVPSVIGAGLAAIVLILYLRRAGDEKPVVPPGPSPADRDREACAIAGEADTVEAWRGYVEGHPGGSCAARATERIAFLEQPPWDRIVQAGASGSLTDLDRAVREVFPDHTGTYEELIRVEPTRPFSEIQRAITDARDGAVVLFEPGQYKWERALAIHERRRLALVGRGDVEIYVKMGDAVIDVRRSEDVKLIGLFLNHYGPVMGGWKDTTPSNWCGTVMTPVVVRSNVVQLEDVKGFGAFESELDGSGFIGLRAIRSSGAVVQSRFVDCLSDAIAVLDASRLDVRDAALFRTGSRSLCDGLKIPRLDEGTGVFYECAGSRYRFPSAVFVDRTSSLAMERVTIQTPEPVKNTYALRVEGALEVRRSIVSHALEVIGNEGGAAKLEETCVTKAVPTARASVDAVTVVASKDLFAAPPETAHFDARVQAAACGDYGAKLRQPLIVKRTKPTQ